MKNIPIYYDSDNKLEMFISDTGDYVCAAVLAVYKVYTTETDYLKQD